MERLGGPAAGCAAFALTAGLACDAGGFNPLSFDRTLVGVAAVTLGPDGCYVAGEGFDGHVPGFEVEAVDGTGAGDAFAAGFLYGLLAEWPLELCARFANAAGALATTALGAFEGVGDLDRTLDVARRT